MKMRNTPVIIGCKLIGCTLKVDKIFSHGNIIFPLKE